MSVTPKMDLQAQIDEASFASQLSKGDVPSGLSGRDIIWAKVEKNTFRYEDPCENIQVREERMWSGVKRNRFIQFRSARDLLEYMVAHPSSSYHDCFGDEKPVKMCFDLDGDSTLDPRETEDEFLRVIKEVFKSKFKIDPEIRVATCHRETKKSWHLYVVNCRVANRLQARIIADLVLKKLPKKLQPILDTALYQSHHSLRILGSLKAGDPKSPAFVTSTKVGARTLELINRYVELGVEIPQATKLSILEETLLSLPEEIPILPALPIPPEYVAKEHVSETIDDEEMPEALALFDDAASFDAVMDSGSRIRLNRISESLCKICGVIHEKDNQFIYKSKGYWWLGCFRASGKKLKPLKLGAASKSAAEEEILEGFVKKSEYLARKAEFEKDKFWLQSASKLVCIEPNENLIYLTREQADNNYGRAFDFSTYDEKNRRYIYANFMKMWMHDPEGRVVSRIVFKEKAEDGEYNLFTGFDASKQPAPENEEETKCAMEAYDMFLRLLDAIAGEHAYYIRIWCADLFQNPFKLPEVALVFTEPRGGAGKSSIGKLLERLVGDRMKHTCVDPNEFFSTHSLARHGKMFINFEEMGSYEAAKYSSLMMAMITSETATVNPKHVTQYDISFSGRILITSQEPDPVKLVGDGRKYCVIHAGTGLTGNSDFWTRWYELLGLGYVRRYIYEMLMKEKFTRDQVVKRPESEYMKELKENSVPLVVDFMNSTTDQGLKSPDELYTMFHYWCAGTLLLLPDKIQTKAAFLKSMSANKGSLYQKWAGKSPDRKTTVTLYRIGSPEITEEDVKKYLQEKANSTC